MARMIDLNDDLLLEIFSKLPAGTISRSKSVCKQWNNLLNCPLSRAKLPQTMSGFYFDNAPSFASTERNPNNDAGENNLITVTLDYFPTDPQSDTRVQITHVSDGLLLCNYIGTNFVTNPITRSYELLPPIPEQTFNVDNMVLGFDRRNNDSNYIVLANLTPHEETTHTTYVFSRRMGNWIPFSYERRNRTITADGVVVHQERQQQDLCMSWYVRRSICYIDGVFYFFQLRNFGEDFIAALDVERGLLRDIRLPLEINRREIPSYSMGKKSEGCLMIGGFGTLRSKEDEEIRSGRFHVWMLEDVGGENWELKIAVDFENLSLPVDFYVNPPRIILLEVIGFHPDYDIVFVRTNYKEILAFNMRNEKFTKICKGMVWFQTSFVYTPLWVDIFATSINDY